MLIPCKSKPKTFTEDVNNRSPLVLKVAQTEVTSSTPPFLMAIEELSSPPAVHAKKSASNASTILMSVGFMFLYPFTS